MLPTLLAPFAHHLLAFLLIALLAAELTLVRPDMSPADRRLIGRVDAAYGLVALALLVIGLWRVASLEKGLEFYMTSVWFWVKIGAFLLVGLFSIAPTLRFRIWGRLGDATPDPTEVHQVRRWLKAQATLLPVIPAAAALMARGY